jgi:hypothetical protein
VNIRDVLSRVKDGIGKARYKVEWTGPNRKERRETAAQARVTRMTPKNWNRDKHKRRRIQKARRKQGRVERQRNRR